MKTILVDWTEPMFFEDALNSTVASRHGIYQITTAGTKFEHLIYIGMVQSSRRTFYQRLLEHQERLLQQYNQKRILIRFGKLQSPGYRVTRRLIKEVEGAIIFEVKPSGNLQGLNSYSLREDIIIKHTGDRGFIPKQINTKKHIW